MNGHIDALERRERLIAALLWYGTWSAVAIVGAGWAAMLLGHHGLIAAKIGIALFILLPVMRVVLMLIIFVRDRDYRYVAIASLVLGIVVAAAIIAAL